MLNSIIMVNLKVFNNFIFINKKITAVFLTEPCGYHYLDGKYFTSAHISL